MNAGSVTRTKSTEVPRFNGSSRRKLETCNVEIQMVFNEVIRHFDCTIVWGHRGKAEQNEAFSSGNSKLEWPDSKHNKKPSDGIDAVPCPIDWEDVERFRYFAGYVMGMAALLGVHLRWGGDWDQDTDLKDQNFNDLAHFELVEEE